jgi:hypothetical protein
LTRPGRQFAGLGEPELPDPLFVFGGDSQGDRGDRGGPSFLSQGDLGDREDLFFIHREIWEIREDLLSIHREIREIGGLRVIS